MRYPSHLPRFINYLWLTLPLLALFATAPLAAAAQRDNRRQAIPQPTATLVAFSVNGDQQQLQSTGLALGQAQADTVTQLYSGNYHNCVVRSDGKLKCWGFNATGQLGDGTTSSRTLPVAVDEVEGNVATLAAGSASFTCILTHSDGVKCWGHNFYGQVGDGTTTNRATPVDVIGLSSGVRAIFTGAGNACAIMNRGAAKCWGDNGQGQVGDGTKENRTTPVDVNGLSSDVTDLAIGQFHVCALLTTGIVKCWGSNHQGQLGDGTTTERLFPVDVQGLSGKVTAIEAGISHTCALINNGSVQCWGWNTFAQLGDGTQTDRSLPTAVVGLSSGVQRLTAGVIHNCVLMTNGSAKCWGYNDHAQLGDGTTTTRTAPVTVGGLDTPILLLDAGLEHTCALTNAGTVKCWGGNALGQLGDGTRTDRALPTDVRFDICHWSSGLYLCTITAMAGWQELPLTLQQGTTFQITYQSGAWTVDSRTLPYVAADGYSSTLDSTIAPGCKVDSALTYATLLGQIGGGTIFPVGQGGHFTANENGYLALRINDQDGCLEDNDGMIELTVTDPTTAIDLEVTTISLSDQPICAGAAHHFYASIQNNGTTISGPFTILWKVDDTLFAGSHNSIAAGAIDTHGHYWENISIGQHTLTFTADDLDQIIETNEANNQHSRTFTVVDCSPANPAFTASPTTGTLPLTVAFTDQSTGNITAWSWNFGDDQSSTQRNPTHVYQSNGDFTVSLTVSGPTGSVTTTKTNYIHVNAPPQVPSANFAASPQTGNQPLTVNFTDQSTGNIATWTWSFGDGSTSTQQNPTHIYNNTGDFTVSLTVTGPGGANTKTLPSYIHVTLPLPGVPGLAPINNPDQNGDYTVAWNASTNATSYELQEQRNSGSWTTLYTGANTNYPLSGKGDGNWCYHVRAVNPRGSSNWSSSQCATVVTPVNPPSVPVLNTIINEDADNNYAISWSSATGATTYALQERAGNGSWTTIYTGSAISYSISGKASGEWCYQVRATNSGGSSNWSAPRCIVIVAATAQPILSLQNQGGAPGSAVTVRIVYEANAHLISSSLFSLDYDHTRLTPDRNGDGTPDSIQFRNDLPTSSVKSVTLDASDTDGELDFMVADFAASPKILPSGTLVEVTLFVLPTVATPSQAPLHFAVASFGGVAGDVTGVTRDGTISINQQKTTNFLPLVTR